VIALFALPLPLLLFAAGTPRAAPKGTIKLTDQALATGSTQES
jgi:hypothetical protein